MNISARKTTTFLMLGLLALNLTACNTNAPLQRRLCCHAVANPLQQITAIPITVNPLGV